MGETLDSPMIGGKAKGLNFLKQNGYFVPRFYSLPFEILNDKLALKAELSNIINKQTNNFRWAVRSSASIEDGTEKSYAGQFKTLLNLKSEDVEGAIYTVIDSYSNIQDNKYGVIIQEMIQPEISGVIFSKDPVDLISLDTIISLVPGIGSKLVNGELEGCTLNIKDETLNSIDPGEFEGFHYNDSQEASVSMSHQEIQQIISKHLPEIMIGINKLEKLLGIPVDVEFSIAQDKLCWLQQRPITSRNFISASAVWDKTAAEISFPGYTLPLSCSLNNRSIGLAFKKVDAAVGYTKRILKQNEAFSSQMSAEINGALYYNVTSWQSLIYQLPFGKKYAKQLPITWGMIEMPFQFPSKRHKWLERVKIGAKISIMLLRSKKYQDNYTESFQQILDLVETTKMDELKSSELLDLFLKIEDELTAHYFAPVSNGYFAMVAFTKLKEQLSKTKILEKHPNFANDVLMNQKDLISVAAVKGLRSLLNEIASNQELYQLFQTKNSKQILTDLEENHFQFFNSIEAYILDHGHRAPKGDLKIENVTFHDDPLVFIDYLRINSAHYKSNSKSDISFDYDGILNEYLGSKFLKKRKIKKLINKAITRTRDRELYRYQRSEAFSISRKIFRKIGNHLKIEGCLENEADVAYLTFEELESSDNRSNYKTLVQIQKEAYEAYQKQEFPATFVEAKGTLHPVHQKIATLEDGQIKGVGCCSGVVSGKVIIVTEETNLQQDFSEHILIGLSFEPGQMNLISSAKGIISERGNLLSHTAIICREMGIPSIVGVKGITKYADHDSQIKMNGGTGIIQML